MENFESTLISLLPVGCHYFSPTHNYYNRCHEKNINNSSSNYSYYSRKTSGLVYASPRPMKVAVPSHHLLPFWVQFLKSDRKGNLDCPQRDLAEEV